MTKNILILFSVISLHGATSAAADTPDDVTEACLTGECNKKVIKNRKLTDDSPQQIDDTLSQFTGTGAPAPGSKKPVESGQ